MVNLARILVWGSFDEKGHLHSTFRVTEESELVDENDRPYSPQPGTKAGVVHPLHMSADSIAKWSEVFSDYALVSPFKQFQRSVYKLEAAELTQREIKRFANAFVPPLPFSGTLDKQGWQRGDVGDGGNLNFHMKYFESADLTAIVEHSDVSGCGLWIGALSEGPNQAVTSCAFTKGQRRSHWGWGRTSQPIELKDVPDVIMSEVLLDLYLLTAKSTG